MFISMKDSFTWIQVPMETRSSRVSVAYHSTNKLSWLVSEPQIFAVLCLPTTRLQLSITMSDFYMWNMWIKLWSSSLSDSHFSYRVILYQSSYSPKKCLWLCSLTHFHLIFVHMWNMGTITSIAHSTICCNN